MQPVTLLLLLAHAALQVHATWDWTLSNTVVTSTYTIRPSTTSAGEASTSLVTWTSWSAAVSAGPEGIGNDDGNHAFSVQLGNGMKSGANPFGDSCTAIGSDPAVTNYKVCLAEEVNTDGAVVVSASAVSAYRSTWLITASSMTITRTAITAYTVFATAPPITHTQPLTTPVTIKMTPTKVASDV